MNPRQCLEDGLNSAAVVRTTYETLNLFPPDDPIRDEMLAIVYDARLNLTRTLVLIRNQMQAEPQSYRLDYDVVKHNLLILMTRGREGSRLNLQLKVNVFATDGPYRLELDGLPSLEQVRYTPDTKLLPIVLNALANTARKSENYAEGATFDREVFRPYLAVLWAIYANSDPIFYR